MEKQKAVVFLRERIWGAGQKGACAPEFEINATTKRNFDFLIF
jgi:hypothetical protein